jgi:PAS domain S-box-containing protein
MPSTIDPTPSSFLPYEEKYGDPERITSIFQWFLIIISLGLVGGIIVSLSNGNLTQARIVPAGFVPLLFSQLLIRRKKYEAAAVLLALFLIGMVTLICTLGLGIHHISILGLPAILIVASLVTRKRTLVLLILFTVLCVAWLVFGELAGLYTPARLERSVTGDFITATMIIISTVTMVRLISESMIQSNIRYRKELRERMAVEEALAFSEKRFYEVFQSSPVMMTIENKDHVFIDANPAFMETTGFLPDEILGHRASDLNLWAAAEDLEKVRKLLDQQKNFKNLELRFRRKNGEIGVALMSSDHFEVNGMAYELTSALDITRRKRIEAEREELILELKVKNNELEQFNYTVSHDLKSPIITVKGFLGFLEQDLANQDLERVQSDVKRVNDAMDHMNRLLNELLELSRIGRVMNPPEDVPVDQIVKDALRLVQGRLNAKGVRVQTQTGLPVVRGDRQRLTEVLLNLLDNAAKFMGQRPNPQIEIGQRGTEEGRPVFFVRDNGIGIAPKFHETIFGLFNRLDPTADGTGIGLALVKRIVEFHGGRIWVESEEGAGSTFLFTLPPADAQKPSPRL